MKMKNSYEVNWRNIPYYIYKTRDINDKALNVISRSLASRVREVFKVSIKDEDLLSVAYELLLLTQNDRSHYTIVYKVPLYLWQFLRFEYPSISTLRALEFQNIYIGREELSNDIQFCSIDTISDTLEYSYNLLRDYSELVDFMSEHLNDVSLNADMKKGCRKDVSRRNAYLELFNKICGSSDVTYSELAREWGCSTTTPHNIEVELARSLYKYLRNFTPRKYRTEKGMKEFYGN